MEFTPKKQGLSAVNASTLRHNPYSARGGTYLRRFQQNQSPVLVTPPRPNNRRPQSRTDRILSASKSLPVIKKVPESPVRPKKSPQPLKRPFSAVNGEPDSNDPYNVFGDSDEENRPSPRKEVKSQEKENRCQVNGDEVFSSYKETIKPLSSLNTNNKSILENPRPKAVKVYTNKRKPFQVTKSRLVSDISPEKVERAYAPKSLFQAEKENVPAQSHSDSSSASQVLSPHLIGFPNYGNTCYLNSVLQSLLGLPTFLCDYRQISSELGLNHKSLFYGLGQVLYNRMKGQASGVKVSLRTVKENLERIDGSFSGFKMQDANEFLTKVLDTIKDEIDRGYASQFTTSSSAESQESLACASTEDLDEDIFLSGVRKKSSLKVINVNASEEMNLSCSDVTDNEIVNCAAQFGGVTVGDRNTETNSEKSSVVTLVQDDKGEKGRTDEQPVNGLKNPVKDNFEFQLLESYRCLGCGEVEGRKQSYFGLYVNLPENGGHTLQDAVSTYMGADERELTCEKCGHKTTSVVTTITSVPRILIIQLKRYEYKPEQCESIKMSSKVLVNQWITLDEFMASEVSGPSQWNPESKKSLQMGETSRQATLTTRNISSEMNKCDPKDEQDSDELPSLTPNGKIYGGSSTSVEKDEEEDLQMAMRRSMEETQGGQEEDEIQQAIRLSLQEMGMSYSQENQEEGHEQDDDEKLQAIDVTENQESGRHAYCLISIISHFGLTTNTGHYVSDVYNAEEESWYHYDDESVAKISESVVFAEGRQKNGYIFFYMHKDLLQKIRKSKR